MNTRPAHHSSAVVAPKKLPNIPGYQLVEQIGGGEWACVYRACENASGTIVALKTLHGSALRDPRVRQRFLREASVLRAHLHPYVLGILGAGEANGCPYLVMPYCAGGDLEAYRQRLGGRLSVLNAVQVMRTAMQGLAALHAQGFVHRDVKPENILFDGYGISILADFGLAKCMEEAGLSGITSSSAVGIGSVGFLPREQVTNFRFVHAATDVWAAAATFYHLVTGVFPRPAQAQAHVIESILNTSAISLRDRDPTISRSVGKVIDRALRDDVHERYANAGVFFKALERAL